MSTIDGWSWPGARQRAQMLREADSVIAAASEAAAAAEQLRLLLLRFADSHGECTALRFGARDAAHGWRCQLRRYDAWRTRRPAGRRRRGEAESCPQQLTPLPWLTAKKRSQPAPGHRQLTPGDTECRQAADRHRLKVLASRQPA